VKGINGIAAIAVIAVIARDREEPVKRQISLQVGHCNVSSCGTDDGDDAR